MSIVAASASPRYAASAWSEAADIRGRQAEIDEDLSDENWRALTADAASTFAKAVCERAYDQQRA